MKWHETPTEFFSVNYALDLISEVDLLEAKSVSTPLKQNHKLGLTNSANLEDLARYKHLVRRLVYLFFTQPDLSYCVNLLAQSMHIPKQAYWEVALRVVWYLKGNPSQGILL